MTFTNEQRREYREYADAAEYWREQRDYTLATEALSDAIYAAGFDNSGLRFKNLLDILTECHGTLPADPWFLTVLARRATGKNLYKRGFNLEA